MSFIPTRVHAVLDYVIGLCLIVAPWVLGFSENAVATAVPVIIGASVLAYSLLTDYEYAVARMIDMRVHLGLDIVGGAVLALSPWLFGFADHVWIPHLVVGVLEIGAAVCTQSSPVYGGAATGPGARTGAR